MLFSIIQCQMNEYEKNTMYFMGDDVYRKCECTVEG